MRVLVRVLVLVLVLMLVRVWTRVSMSVVVTMKMRDHAGAWRGWRRRCSDFGRVSRVMIVRMLMLMRVGVRVRVRTAMMIVFIGRRWMRVMKVRIRVWRPLYLR